MRLVQFIRVWLVCLAITSLYVMALAMLWLVRAVRGKRAPGLPPGGIKLMITGRVNSNNWSRSHLLPLSEAGCVREIVAAMDGPLLKHPKMRPCLPSPRLQRLLPRALARSVAFFRAAASEKPDIIMGYSFFPGALFGLLAARAVGARAIYQNTGGSVEILNGGVSRDIGLPEVANHWLMPLACAIGNHFDAAVVRGERTRSFLVERATSPQVVVIAGSVDTARFPEAHGEREYDIVFLGRVVPVKQPEHLLEVISRAVQRRTSLRAVIAGDGFLLPVIKEKAAQMGVDRNIEFAGHVEIVEDLLLRSKVFLLTSKSEGLSIALAEAMMAGAVPVVADVGDLGELVRNDETGWLIAPGDFDGYAARICAMLEDQATWKRLSENARRAAMDNNSLASVTARWDKCFSSLMQGEGNPVSSVADVRPA